MKKAIVTGANGFVGTWLVQELAKNNIFVYAVVRDESEDCSLISELDNVRIVYSDISDYLYLKNIICENDIDVFYHLAWVGSGGALRSNYKVQLDNAIYSCDAATAAKELGCKKFLCAGTITENIVDATLDNVSVSQNMLYGIAKKATRLAVNVVCQTLHLDYIWMQFSNIYGPHNMSGNLISYTLNELVNKRVPEFSKGEQPYDFIYVKDLVKAARLLGFSETQSNTYFLGSGSPRKLKEYLTEIPQCYGEGYSVAIGKRPEDGIVYDEKWFITDNLHKDTGFHCDYTFEDGLKETIAWMKQ